MIIFDSIDNELVFHKEISPVNIWKFYLLENEFIFLSTDNVKNIPITRNKHELLQSICYKHKYSSYHLSIVFNRYAEGFLKGFATEFKPFIQTPENQKEMILKAIILPINEHPFRSMKNSDDNIVLSLNGISLYRMGEKMGKNYKAWILLLETPKYYENDPIFISRLPSLHLGLGPFRSMESLYVAAQVTGIVIDQHPGHRQHDLYVHKENFTKWLIEKFNLKDKEDSEYFISLLTLTNFKKYLQSDNTGKLYLRTKIANDPAHQILEVKAHIIWLKQQLSNQEQNKQIILLNLKLKEMNDFIDNLINIVSKNKNGISESTQRKIVFLKKQLDEIEAKNDFSSYKRKEPLEQKVRLEPKTFEELFVDPFNKDLHEACINVLRNSNPPLISSEYKYIGKSKASVCIWLLELEKQDIIKLTPDYKVYSDLLSQKFQGFSVHKTTFTKPNKRLNSYKKYLQSEINRIKLSFFSSKRQ